MFPQSDKKLGFGFMRLPMVGEEVDLAETQKMVDTFLDRGFYYFDTAHPYLQGKSEQALKACLTDRYPRERYMLANKLSDGCFEGRAGIEPFLDAQLSYCGVNWFDVYLLHAMSAQRHDKFEAMGVYEEVARLKQEGKIRHMGISFHDTAEVLDRILTERPEIEVVQIQLNYVDMEDPVVQSRACYEICRKHGKPIIIMEPVKGGALASLPVEGTMSPAGYALRFAAGFEGVAMVLSGMSNQQQLEDNTSVMADFVPLNPHEQEAIAKARTVYQAQNKIPCTACRYCIDGCPAGIPIPRIFACMNKQDDEGFRAVEQKPSECVDCGQCERVCPQKLSIRELLKAAQARLLRNIGEKHDC